MLVYQRVDVEYQHIIQSNMFGTFDFVFILMLHRKSFSKDSAQSLQGLPRVSWGLTQWNDGNDGEEEDFFVMFFLCLFNDSSIICHVCFGVFFA